MRLEGKVAVVTSAGSETGRAIAESFAREGAFVVATDSHRDVLDQTVHAVQAAGGTITGIRGDISDETQAEDMIDRATQLYGRLDILCNNAGATDNNEGVTEIQDETWERVLDMNLNGPMYLTRRAIPVMLASGGGSIINTSSVAGLEGGAAGLAYTVSEHGLVGMTQQTAVRYGSEGIRCNAIAAGAADTECGKSLDTAAIPQTVETADVATLALYLASDESSTINGYVLPADGGTIRF